MLFYQDNHQAEKDIEEIEKIENTAERMFTMELHITFSVCVCVCVCRLYLQIIAYGCIRDC